MDLAALSPVGTAPTPALQGLVQGLAQRALQAALQAAVSPAGAPVPAQATGLDLVAGAVVDRTTGTAAAPAAAASAGTATVDLDTAGAGADFALLTALRHGAGVGTQAALTAPPGDLPGVLLRDPAAVPALSPLRDQGPGPGLEAASQAPAGGRAAVAAYQVPAPPPGPGALDLLARPLRQQPPEQGQGHHQPRGVDQGPGAAPARGGGLQGVRVGHGGLHGI